MSSNPEDLRVFFQEKLKERPKKEGRRGRKEDRKERITEPGRKKELKEERIDSVSPNVWF